MATIDLTVTLLDGTEHDVAVIYADQIVSEQYAHRNGIPAEMGITWTALFAFNAMRRLGINVADDVDEFIAQLATIEKKSEAMPADPTKPAPGTTSPPS